MPQTIRQILEQAYQQIDKLDADLLLSFTLKKPREYFLIHDDEKISNKLKNKFNNLVKKRKSGLPLAYITGHKEFFGLDFLVNKHTLVPRPDTEILVESAIKAIDNYQLAINNKQRTNKKLLLIDVGTGSGCIPISIIKTFKHLNMPTFAIDISKKALLMAQKNARKHKVKIKFLHGDLLKPFQPKIDHPQGEKSKLKFENIIITANLPYLTTAQFKAEKSIQHEPKSALVAKKSGLALYEQLFKQIKLLVTNYELPITCLIEIDPSQTKKIIPIIKKFLSDSQTEIKKDLSGQDRVVIIKN